MLVKSQPVQYLDGNGLNNFLASQGLDQVSRRPFWFNQDDGEVLPLRQQDQSVLVQQKLLEASFSSNIPSYPLDSPFNNVNHYRSVVYLAIQAQMNALSAGRLVMEVPRPGGTLQGDHGDGDDGYIPFTDHQLYDYLLEPSPSQSFSAFLGEAILQWYLTGRVLIWGVPNEWGLPVRFYVLPTALCQPAFNLNNQLYPEGAWLVQQYYPYTGMVGLLPGPLGTPGAIIDAREIYQMKNPHPLYKWAPFSPMTGVSVGIDVLEMIDRSCWSVYRNGVKPTGVLTVPGARQDQIEDVEAKLNQKYTGPDNAGKTFVTGGRPDAGAPQYTPLNATPDSMAYDTRSVYESLILAGVTGSDRAVVGLREGGSYSERWAAIQDVQIRTYEPMCRRVCDMLNTGPVKQWGLTKKRVRVRIKLPKIDDPLLNEQRINARSADGSFSTDEIRAQSGMPPDPLGLGHLPTGVRQQVILMLAEQGSLPGNPNPPTPGMEVVDVADPADDGTALGALRSGMELPDGEPVGPQGAGLKMQPKKPANSGMRGKGVPTPKPKKVEEKKPAGGKAKKKGKKRQAKALPENPEHRTEAVVAIHNHLLEHPLDHTARSIYADELEDAGAHHEATVHRAIATAHLPLDDPNNHWDMVRNSATHETGVVASHIAREMTEHGRRGTNNDRVGYGSNARIALENAHTGARHDAIRAHAAAQRVHAAEARYYNDDTSDDRDMRAKHTAAESAHLVAEAVHRSLQYRNAQAKAMDSGTDALGGSLVLPPSQTPLPGRKKRRRRKPVSALVAEVLGDEDDSLEVKAQPPTFNRVRVTRHHLATLPIVHAVQLHEDVETHGAIGGKNLSSLVTLDHPRRQIRGIWKPQLGEHPTQLRLSVPHMGQTDRESLASHVAEIVGVHDLVPPTSLRTEHGIRGSIQRFVPGARPAYGEEDNHMRYGPSHTDVMRAGAFDYLIGNTDRHAGNWLLRPHKAAGEKLTLIDHGLSFPEVHTHEYKETSYLHEHAARLQEEHGYETPDITGGGNREKWGHVLKAMVGHGLSTDAINETRRRWNLLANNRHSLTQLHQNSTHALTEKL